MNMNNSPEAVMTPSTDSTDLDQLIEERNALALKLKIIRDQRTSGVNNEPFPIGAFEQLRSNDVWEIVLECLTDPTDVTSAYFTCGTFAEILEDRRVLMLLLNIFKEKVDLAYKYKYNFEDEEIENTCFQNWNDICISARGVCKAWKKTVDFHSDIAKDDWIKMTGWDFPRNRSTSVSFKNSESVDEVTSSLISHGLTNSPIRDVLICVDLDPTSSEIYRRKLVEYFKAYGNSVKFLWFYCESPGNMAHEILCEILKFVKNLKGLDALHFGDTDGMEGGHQGVQQGLNEYPLPVLESLVHFSCWHWEKESFVSQILKKCVHLKSLDFGQFEPTKEETTEALMALSLEQFEGLPNIITSNQFKWPLKELKIVWKEGMDFNASVILPAVNRFQETLESLILPEVKMDPNARVKNIRLELPNLKSVVVSSILHGTIGYNDLLHLKSLEEISMGSEYEDENENSLVKVKMYVESGEMHKSNIWQCFPNLMRFQDLLDLTYYFRPTSN